jgi:hypothetical protein
VQKRAHVKCAVFISVTPALHYLQLSFLSWGILINKNAGEFARIYDCDADS